MVPSVSTNTKDCATFTGVTVGVVTFTTLFLVTVPQGSQVARESAPAIPSAQLMTAQDCDVLHVNEQEAQSELRQVRGDQASAMRKTLRYLQRQQRLHCPKH